MAEQQFQRQLKNKGIHHCTIDELKRQGCDNLKLFFTLRYADIDSLNLSEGQNGKLKRILNNYHGIRGSRPSQMADNKSKTEFMYTDQAAALQMNQRHFTDAQESSYQIKPTSSEFYRRNVNSQVYMISDAERGQCVIFNLLQNEKDAKADCDKLGHLFSKLHFSIELYSGKGVLQMRNQIQSYTRLVRRKKYQCVVVIFLGLCSANDISGPDVKTPYKIIYEEFKNFEDIPKLFLFISYGNSTSGICPVNAQNHLLPRDTFTCFGFQNAGDNEQATASNQGSQFAEIVTRFLVEHACCRDFSDLLKEVKKTLEQEKTGMVSFKDNFGRKLYFFPGITTSNE